MTSSHSPSLATIPDVTVSQLIGGRLIPLAYGILTLQDGGGVGTSTATSISIAGEERKKKKSVDLDADDHPQLLIQIGEALLFPLYSHTVFGTHAQEETWYTFDVPVKRTAQASPSSSAENATTTAATTSSPSSKAEPSSTAAYTEVPKQWVRLVFPPLTTPELLNARDTFEDVLIQRKFLLDGIRAIGDEVGSSASQEGHNLSLSLGDLSRTHRTSAPSVKTEEEEGEGGEDWKFSRTSHRASETILAGSEKLASASNTAAEAVSSLAAAAGGAFGSAYKSVFGSEHAHQEQRGLVDPPPPHQQQQQIDPTKKDDDDDDNRLFPNTRDAISDTLTGLQTGASTLYQTSTHQTPLIIQDNLGKESAKLATEVGQSVKHLASTMLDVTVGTSSIYHGTQAVKEAAVAGGSKEAISTTEDKTSGKL